VAIFKLSKTNKNTEGVVVVVVEVVVEVVVVVEVNNCFDPEMAVVYNGDEIKWRKCVLEWWLWLCTRTHFFKNRRRFVRVVLALTSSFSCVQMRQFRAAKKCAALYLSTALDYDRPLLFI
jgi:hypothetical protein